jgi:phage major head subunit gpT-like protein
MDVETRMRIVSVTEYERLNKQAIWRRLAKRMSSNSRRERLMWLLDTAKIEYVNRKGGEVQFEEILGHLHEYEHKAATGGHKVNRFDLEDADGGGVNSAAHWARQMGAYAAYWPEKQVLKVIRDGEQASTTSFTYDGQKFFDVDHPVNPFDSSVGLYTNVFTGAAAAAVAGVSGATPGACPIDNSVTVDVAFANLTKAITFVESSYVMANGEDPKRMKVAAILAPTALGPRLQQLTNAKIIAQAATGGGAASAEIDAIIRNWGLGEPMVAPELGAGFTNGSDTSYYLITESMVTDEIGPLIYSEREPFGIVYNGEMTDAQLARANEIQWLTRGRNVVAYGHPFGIIKVKGS